MGRAGSGGGSSSGGGGSHSFSRSTGSHSIGSHSRAGSGSSSRGSGYGGFHSGGYHGGYRSGGMRYYGRGGYNSNVSPMFLALVVIAIIILSVVSNYSNKPMSTKNRDKLTNVPAYSSDCITDELDWFDSPGRTGASLEKFYNATGIQPYIYLRAYDPAMTSNATREAMTGQIFEQLGLAENAMLIVYFAEEDTDNDVGEISYAKGMLVSSVMDSEAMEIFFNYVDRYWYTDMTTDAMFVSIYTKTAETIMTKSKTLADVLWIVALIVAVIVIATVTIMIIKKKRKAEADRAAETERILRTPMSDLQSGADYNEEN